MTDQQYDNSNRGAGWPRKAMGGTLDVGGQSFYIDLVQTGRPAPAPAYNLYATSAASRTLYGCGLFVPKPEAQAAAAAQGKKIARAKGVLNLLDAGGEQWVSLWVNDPDPEGRKPLIGLTVQAKDQQPGPPMGGSQEQSTLPPPPGDDDIPF